MNDFLPIFPGQITEWDYYDFLFISGDAYVDHPSFGGALIARWLSKLGYRVYMCPQPTYTDCTSIMAYGRPRLAVMISGGSMDGMVNHYTVSKKKRSNDAYSPGGDITARPDRPVIVYANRVREAFGNIPIIIGGIEASLRRFAHYDYWTDKVRRSILIDSSADLLVFGMGETQAQKIAEMLESGQPLTHVDIPGTAYVTTTPKGIILPSFDQVKTDKMLYAKAAHIIEQEQNPISGMPLSQYHDNKIVVQNIPTPPLTQSQMDRVYSMPFTRQPHPFYKDGIDALKEVKFSITRTRGCYGSCSFCALSMHQGRMVVNRSKASVVNEARALTHLYDFKGYIHDIGGPSANLSLPCQIMERNGGCRNKQCLFPHPCKNLTASHKELLETLREVRQLPGVKKVFIRSGIRYDYLMLDKSSAFWHELCQYHISGQLKVAPEHISEHVLKLMGKPSRQIFDQFLAEFRRENTNQFLVPYLMSSHPGCTLKDMADLALYLKQNKLYPEQVQDFYPTPGTIATAMYHTGLNPRTLKPVYVAKDYNEKRMQRALLQFRKRENRGLVVTALKKIGRTDLIKKLF